MPSNKSLFDELSNYFPHRHIQHLDVTVETRKTELKKSILLLIEAWRVPPWLFSHKSQISPPSHDGGYRIFLYGVEAVPLST